MRKQGLANSFAFCACSARHSGLPQWPPTMGQQSNKIIKRRRRADYLKRKHEQAKLGGTVKHKAVSTKSAGAKAAAAKKPAAKKLAKKAPAKKLAKKLTKATEAEVGIDSAVDTAADLKKVRNQFSKGDH